MLRLGAAHCASAYQAPELQLNGPRCRPFVAGHFNLRPRVRVLDNCIVCAAFRPEAGTRKVSDAISKQSKSIVIGSLSILLGLSVHTGTVSAADFVKVQLAKCIADPTCAQNIACLQNCNGREDESECQIRCGDLYASPAVEEFTKCAVSEKGCVPQRKDNNEYPIPPDRDLVAKFDLSQFTGRWNIAAGLNNLFDTFPCQLHDFKLDSPKTLHADIRWRVPQSDKDFIERNAVQTFNQDPNKPGYLRNDNNDFLNYTDDWYILGFKPDVYAVIYYRGNNDAWQGYGGLTVYTRDLELPEQYKGEINEALKKINLDLSELRRVDNSCPPHPQESATDRIGGAIEDLNPKKASTEAPPIDMEG